MDSNHKNYDYIASFDRIDELLAQPRGNYEEVESLPDRDMLTYTNGFYAYCSALFIDIRDSSALPDVYNRPALAKLYRAYISEMVAIVNGLTQTREVNIVGDGVWAVFNTPKKSDINSVFSAACRVNTLVKVLNHKLKHAQYDTPIAVGIGMAYGRALMIKAGYNGSGISDVIYMGDVVNRSAKLAAEGSKGPGTPPMMIDNVFANNLDAHRTSLITKDRQRGCYTANAINTAMNDWYNANCT